MEKNRIFLLAIALFLVFVFLFWLATSKYMKSKFGKKMWNHWPSRLSYWQGAIFYSALFTVLTIFLLRWGNMLHF